jgi:uncharacterized protein YprB with RNaseH-like and TPR domain
VRGYLDIETSFEGVITVVGIYADDRGCIQLVGPQVTEVNLYRALEGLKILCTYNGSRFDLPVIRRRLGADLAAEFESCDLMLECWRFNLKGGLKRVEEQLGIQRWTKGLDGFDAMRLWHRYEATGDGEALATLLEYNREDVVNLKRLDGVLEDLRQCG